MFRDRWITLSTLIFQIAHQSGHIPVLANVDVVTFADAHQALQALPRDMPDLLIVDAALPGLDVLDTIRATRAVSECLLLLVADSADEVDCILALELGADGYLARPFSARELQANIRALMRRGPSKEADRPDIGPDGCIQFRTLNLEIRKGTLSHSSRQISLTSRELNIVRLMMGSPSRVFTREELLEDFRPKKDGDSRAVDMHIANLRKKLAGLSLPYSVLQSVKGRGYRFG